MTSFDRSSRLPILLLILLPFAVHVPQWLLPVHNDPIWQFSFLTKGMHSTGLPGHKFLDPYIAFTSDSFGPLIARDWFHGIVPWWNPYVGIGVPLAGQMQPGVFFLPFVLLLALPGGVTLLTISIQIVSGLSTYALLRELKVSRLAALTGGGLYALNGTIAWVPGPAAVICTLAFLPLLLWGIERARGEKQGAVAMLAIGVAIAWSLFAGFPETAYLDGLLGLSWFIFRCLGSDQRWVLTRRVVMGGSLGLLFATPLLIAFAQELAVSGLLNGHMMGDGFRPFRSLAMLLMPAVYGPANSGVDNGSGMATVWGGIGGYSSALIMFFAVLSFTGRASQKGLRLLLAGWTLVSLAKTYGFGPAMALVNALPLLKVTAFDRYAPPSWELSLIVLAMLGLDNLRERRGLRAAGVITLCLVVLSIILAWPKWRWSSLAALMQSEWLIAAGLWAVGLTVIAWIVGKRRIAAALLIVDAAVMFCLPQTVGSVGGELDLSVVRFLQAHAGLSRVVTLGPLTPNYGAYFGFAELNHNMSPLPETWLNYINTRLLPNFRDVDGGATFWPVKTGALDAASAVLAINQHLADYQDLDVRYVISNPGQSLDAATRMPVPKGRSVPMDLAAGQGVTVHVSNSQLTQPVQEVGVLIGTYGGKSDGDLSLRLCAEAECRSGRKTLRTAADNDFDFVSLDAPLALGNSKVLRLEVRHEGGSSRVALWSWPGQAGEVALQLAFRDGTQMTLANRVFQSQVADVWELPSPRPYFETGSECHLEIADRENVSADCTRAAVMTRRELYMDGWQAQAAGKNLQVRQHGGVLQEVTLPPGHSKVQFHFTPAYMSYGWAAFLIGAIGLGWQLFAWLRVSGRTRPDADRRAV